MTVEDGNTRYIENMDNLNTLYKSMANYLGLSIISGGSQKYINQASALLFPYFYSAYLYTPAVSPNEVIVDDYKQGKWYVPSFAELVRIIYYAGYSIGGEEFT
jgi:hypothetical protein